MWYNIPQRQRSGCTDLLREKVLPFWVAQRRAGRQEKMVLSVESGSQCWVKNGPDFPSDVVFIMPTSVLPISRWGGNWSVTPLVALRVYDFSCCCHCPGWIGLRGTHFVKRRQLIRPCSPEREKNNVETMLNWGTGVHRFVSLKKMLTKNGD